MANNPIIVTDPDGDFAFVPILVGMAIGGAVHTGIHLATHDFTFKDWNWGAFAGSIIAGGVGGGVNSALISAGIGGFAGGAVTGGASGFVQNLSSGLINHNLTFEGIVENILTGAVIGGVTQGISSVLEGNRFSDGAKLISTTQMAVDPSVQPVAQVGQYNCGPACVESIDPNYSQSTVRNWFGGNPNQVGIGDNNLWNKYASISNRTVQKVLPSEGLINKFPSLMNNGRSIAINVRSLGVSTPGHTVVMKSIIQKTYIRTNGQLISKTGYKIMDPAYGGFRNISQKTILDAYKIFIIK